MRWSHGGLDRAVSLATRRATNRAVTVPGVPHGSRRRAQRPLAGRQTHWSHGECPIVCATTGESSRRCTRCEHEPRTEAPTEPVSSPRGVEVLVVNARSMGPIRAGGRLCLTGPGVFNAGLIRLATLVHGLVRVHGVGMTRLRARSFQKVLALQRVQLQDDHEGGTRRGKGQGAVPSLS
jgi:hypothetical protein